VQTNKKFSTKQEKAKSEARYKWILRKQAVNESDIGRIANVYLISHPLCTIHGITFCPMGSSYRLLSLVRY
jgi:hypothetical protein